MNLLSRLRDRLARSKRPGGVRSKSSRVLSGLVGIERLQTRIVPAVTASFNSGTGVLTITGDAAANDVEVGLDGSSNVLVFEGSGNPPIAIIGGTPTSGNTTLIDVDLAGGNDQFRAVTVFDNVTLVGSIPLGISISLLGGAGDDTVIGGNGNDTLDGGDGEDFLSGQDGNDSLIGGNDDDDLNGNGGTDTQLGGAGQDTISADDLDLNNLAGLALPTNVDGGTGSRDRIDFASSTNHSLVVADDAAARGFEVFIGNSGIDIFNLIAVSFAVTLNGGDSGDKLYGGSGDDEIVGGGGSDICDGGLGNDTITGSDGLTDDGLTDVLYGGPGTDIFNIFGQDNVFGADSDGVSRNDADDTGDRGIGRGTSNLTLNMGASQLDIFTGLGTGNYNVTANTKPLPAGAVYILTSGGDDVITGTSLNDTIYTGDGNDSIGGNDGDDTIDAGSGTDSLNGGEGNDLLIGGLGVDTLLGGNGNDVLRIDASGESLDGGAGFDRIIVDTTSGVSVNMGSANAEQFDGNIGDDTVNGNGSTVAMLIYGSGGNDSLIGGTGNDTIYGNAGADILFGQGGNDLLIGGTLGEADNDTLDGSTGNDTLEGGGGSDNFNAGAGNDVVRIGGPTPVLTSTSLSPVGNFVTDYDLVVVDAPIALTLTLEAGYLDEFRGNAGNESIDASSTGSNDLPVILTGNGGGDTLIGGAGNDTISGGDGIDSLTGNGGNDNISGGNEDDNITGDDGNDNLAGDAGNDNIIGGNGNDTLFGGLNTETNTLTGSAGSDLFLFTTSSVGSNIVTDYTPGSPDFDTRKALDTNTDF